MSARLSGRAAGRTAVAVGFALAAAAAAAWPWAVTSTLPPPGEPAEARPYVTEAIAREALASSPPPRTTLSDAVDFYGTRLAARNEDPLARRGLVSAHLLRFRAYGDHRELDAAEAHLRTVLGRGGGVAGMHTDLASLHLARHEFRDALAAARAGDRASGGRDPAARYRLFDAYLAVGEEERAEALLGSLPDTTAVAHLARAARVLDRHGRVADARDRMRGVVERVRAYAEPAPVVAWALVELGTFEYHAGDPAGAVRRYREALRILPGSPAALEGLAAVAWGSDRDDATARALYRRALANGAHLDVVPALADVEEARGDTVEARRLRSSFLERATVDERSERLYRRPLAFVLADHPDAATGLTPLEARTRALALARADLAERADPGAWDALGWVLHRLGRHAEAWSAAGRAVARGVPEPPTAWRAGMLALTAGDTARAVDLLAGALEGSSELGAAEIDAAEEMLGYVATILR